MMSWWQPTLSHRHPCGCECDCDLRDAPRCTAHELAHVLAIRHGRPELTVREAFDALRVVLNVDGR